MKELNTLAPKKYPGNYAGVSPTLDASNGILVGDFAIDTSVSPAIVWQCRNNSIGDLNWVRLVGATDLADVATTGDYNDLQNIPTLRLEDIAERSHTLLTDIGTRTHEQIDAKLSAVARTIGTVGSNADYECDGVDDQVQFAEAIVEANVGDIIKILPGTYNFSSKLTINKSLFFEGVDRSLSIININGPFTGIDVTASGCVFRYLTFFNNNNPSLSNGSRSLMHLRADNQVIDSCVFDWSRDGTTGIFANCRFHEIKRNIIVARYGIFVSWSDFVNYVGSPPQGVIIESNIFGDYAGGRYCRTAVYFSNVQGTDFLIWRNRILSNGDAIWDNNSAAKQISIIANSFSSTGTTIRLIGTRGANININNWASAAYTPVNCIVLENVEGVNIAANNFWSAVTDFIQVRGTSTKVNIIDNIGSVAPAAGVTESGASNYTTLLGNVALGTITLIGANSVNKDSGSASLITRDKFDIARMPTGGNWALSSDLRINTNGIERFFITSTGGIGFNALTYVFPSSHGGAGAVMTNDGSGVLSWVVPPEQWVSYTPTPTSPGTRGQMHYASNYLYVCVNTNTWVKVAVESTWE